MVRQPQDIGVFLLNLTEDAHAQAGTREGMAVNHVIGQTQFHAQLAVHLVDDRPEGALAFAVEQDVLEDQVVKPAAHRPGTAASLHPARPEPYTRNSGSLILDHPSPRQFDAHLRNPCWRSGRTGLT